MRIFITGGTGLVGTNLVRILKETGDELLVLIRPPKAFMKNNAVSNNVRFLVGELSEIENIRNEIKHFAPETVIHLAWEGIPDYGYKTSVKNLEYGIKLLMMMAEIGCKRILATGSLWEYGLQFGQLQEEMSPMPNNAFTASKNALHCIGKEIAKKYDIDFIWARLFYVYGPLEKKTSLFSYVIDCVREGKIPKIKTPFAKNDFVYADDVAKALFLILKANTKNSIFNIGSGYATSVLEIIRLIYEYYDRDLPEGFKELQRLRQTETSNCWADISRIKKETDWEPLTNIKEGIQKTVEGRK